MKKSLENIVFATFSYINVWEKWTQFIKKITYFQEMVRSYMYGKKMDLL